jgi:hypothetical protein
VRLAAVALAALLLAAPSVAADPEPTRVPTIIAQADGSYRVGFLTLAHEPPVGLLYVCMGVHDSFDLVCFLLLDSGQAVPIKAQRQDFDT